MSQKFEDSLRDGIHHSLKAMEGKWKGTTRVWFEPGSEPDVSETIGITRTVLGGRFLLHEYTGSLQGKPIEGMAIFGYSIGDGKLQCAWIDSFHNGTAIMFSQNEKIGLPYSVTGYYGKDTPWGWRTEITTDGENTLTITMYNIEPGEKEQLAVKTVYHRLKG
jgi:hypothetical protein